VINLDVLKLYLLVFLFSLIPTFEGRYALVFGIISGLDPLASLLLASIAITLLSIALGILIELIDSLILSFENSKNKLLLFIFNFYKKYVERVRKKASPYVSTYGLIGLIIFVAIPLPGTGVWTGALAAYILGIKRKITIIALTIGGLLSNLITFLLSYVYHITLI